MQTSIRITDDSEKFLTPLFDNRNEAIQAAIDAYNSIRRYTLKELTGIFTREEIIAMVDNLNGTMLQPEYQANKDIYIAHLEDGEKFEYLSDRFKIDFTTLKTKVGGLTAAQIFFLQAEIERFWRQESNIEDGLEIFVKRFI
jgi:hypothetical protein